LGQLSCCGQRRDSRCVGWAHATTVCRMPRLARYLKGFLAVSLGGVGIAAAQPDSEASRRVSLTMSPLNLQYPVVELMAEVRLLAKRGRAVSAAFIAGYGEYSEPIETNNGVKAGTRQPRAGQLGGQLLYYPLDDFRGLQVGGEVMLVKYLGFDLESTRHLTTVGDGVGVGPFVGYKYLDKTGFTFSGQLGMAYMVQPSHAPATGARFSSSKPSRWFPLVNVNVGWSF